MLYQTDEWRKEKKKITQIKIDKFDQTNSMFVLTHAHIDHLNKLKHAQRVYCSSMTYTLLSTYYPNLIELPEIYNQMILVDQCNIILLKNGHSPGALSIYNDGMLYLGECRIDAIILDKIKHIHTQYGIHTVYYDGIFEDVRNQPTPQESIEILQEFLIQHPDTIIRIRHFGTVSLLIQLQDYFCFRPICEKVKPTGRVTGQCLMYNTLDKHVFDCADENKPIIYVACDNVKCHNTIVLSALYFITKPHLPKNTVILVDGIYRLYWSDHAAFNEIQTLKRLLPATFIKI